MATQSMPHTGIGTTFRLGIRMVTAALPILLLQYVLGAILLPMGQVSDLVLATSTDLDLNFKLYFALILNASFAMTLSQAAIRRVVRDADFRDTGPWNRGLRVATAFAIVASAGWMLLFFAYDLIRALPIEAGPGSLKVILYFQPFAMLPLMLAFVRYHGGNSHKHGEALILGFGSAGVILSLLPPPPYNMIVVAGVILPMLVYEVLSARRALFLGRFNSSVMLLILILPVCFILYPAYAATFAAPADQPAPEMTLGSPEATIRAWLDERAAEIGPGHPPYPVFIVTSDGGGIRASYWTLAVLQSIAQSSPRFEKHLMNSNKTDYLTTCLKHLFKPFSELNCDGRAPYRLAN